MLDVVLKSTNTHYMQFRCIGFKSAKTRIIDYGHGLGYGHTASVFGRFPTLAYTADIGRKNKCV